MPAIFQEAMTIDKITDQFREKVCAKPLISESFKKYVHSIGVLGPVPPVKPGSHMPPTYLRPTCGKTLYSHKASLHPGV